MRQRQVEIPGLADEQVRIFQAAFDHYHAKGTWPILDQIARKLVEDMDVEDVAREVASPWVEDHLHGNAEVKLRLPALAKCRGGEAIVDAFLRALRYGANRYFDKNLEGGITQELLVRDAGLSNELAHEALLLLKSEHLYRRLEGSVPGNLVFHFGPDIRKLRNVQSIDDYLAIRYPPKSFGYRLGTRLAQEPDPEGEVHSYVKGTAFVMMSLGAENPQRDQVAQAIREAFAAYGIDAKHAMDYDEDSVVTETILEKLRSAEFLVADLTGQRPSVYYEIGYAHALGRHPLLVRQTGTRIHFDLAVHNAPEYKDPADLKRLLLWRLGERIGPLPKAVGGPFV